MNMESAESGRYTCIVKNKAGTISRDFFVQVSKISFCEIFPLQKMDMLLEQLLKASNKNSYLEVWVCVE